MTDDHTKPHIVFDLKRLKDDKRRNMPVSVGALEDLAERVQELEDYLDRKWKMT